VYLLVFRAYINEMHGSRSKIPGKKSRPYIYVKFLAVVGAPYIHDISRLRVKRKEANIREPLHYVYIYSLFSTRKVKLGTTFTLLTVILN
jgi:hypothetical protein